MDLRPLVRYVTIRHWSLRQIGVHSRIVAHLLVGNPHQVIIAFYGLAIWDAYNSLFAGLAAWASTAVAAELVLQFIRLRGTSPTGLLLVGWREAWRVRRRWPADWAVVAAKTNAVQAEVGTSEEPKAPPSRPVLDHPKLSWVPVINWPVVSWWVGPPPGRSFRALEVTTAILAANISHCLDIRVDYDRPSDSYGRLFITFDEVGAETNQMPPVDDDPGPDVTIGGPPTDPMPVPPPLRLVRQDAPPDPGDPHEPDPMRQPNLMR